MVIIIIERSDEVRLTLGIQKNRQFRTGRLKNVTFIPLFLDIFQDMNKKVVSSLNIFIIIKKRKELSNMDRETIVI